MSHGFLLKPVHSIHNEGYMTKAQRKQFSDMLLYHPHITTILEIGLNGGHSAENFFTHTPNLKKFVSFDINLHPYTQIAVDYLTKKYVDRFTFISGDSRTEVPRYAQEFPNETFDLIYIDGNHDYEYIFSDIQNCKALAHPNTLLWIDDYEDNVEKAVHFFEQNLELKVIATHTSKDRFGSRKWIEAKYLFSK